MKKLFKDVRTYIFGVYAILNVALLAQIMITAFLPIKYILILGAIMLVFCLIIWWVLYSKKTNNIAKRLMMVLSCLLSVLMIFGVVYVRRAAGLLGDIYADKNIVEVSVVVMKDNSASTMEDLKGKTFGTTTLGDVTYTKKAEEDIAKDLGSAIATSEFNSLETYEAALRNKEVDALILNEASRSLMGETFTADTKIIKTYKYESVAVDIANRVDVSKEPFLVYITGIDSYGTLATVGRSDVNKIMVVNPATKEILLIDIPRDYYIPQVCQGMQNDKLTHTGIFGVDCTVDSVSQFMGIDINYYIRVNFSSVLDIVNALGGVSVESPVAFSTGPYSFVAGTNSLSGEEALAFARERYSLSGGDNDRIENQSRVLKGMIQKATSPAIVSNYLGVMDAVGNSMQTNLNSGEISALVNAQINDMSGWNIESYALKGTGGTDWTPANGFNAYVMYPDLTTVDEAKILIQKVLNGETIDIPAN